MEQTVPLSKIQMKKNVVCFTGGAWSDSVTKIRLKAPLTMAGFRVIQGNDRDNILVENLSSADYVVVQRDFPRYMESYFHIIKQARSVGIPVIYDIDDLLFDLPDDHPERHSSYYLEGLGPMFIAINQADLVTVSSQALADALCPYNPNIRVLNNFLDDSLWHMSTHPKETEHPETVTIGYMGTDTHYPDLMMIVQSIADVIKQYGDSILFKFWGVKPPDFLLANPQVRWYPTTTNYKEFIQSISREKIGILIAPLKSNRFNQCKSHLKFLENTALGAAGIYSRIRPYEEIVIHGENGFLASFQEEWFYYFKVLIESPEIRKEMALKAQTFVKEKWLLSQHTGDWIDAYGSTNAIQAKTLKIDLHNEPMIWKVMQDWNSLMVELKGHITDQEQVIQELRSFLVEEEQKSQALSVQLTEKEQSLQELGFQITDHENKIYELELRFVEHEEEWKKRLVEQEKIVEDFAHRMNQKDETIENLKFRLFEGEKSNQVLWSQLEDQVKKNQALHQQLLDLSLQFEKLRYDHQEVLISKAWKFALFLRDIRVKYFPPGSWRDQPLRFFHHIYKKWHAEGWRGLLGSSSKVEEVVSNQKEMEVIQQQVPRWVEFPEVGMKLTLEPCLSPIDIIVCVHNALEDVKRCFGSVIKYTSGLFNFIIINDGSNKETTTFLEQFSKQYNNISLVNNLTARGYTRAANQGLKLSTADYVILLNSDTVVSPFWVERMVAAMHSQENIGLVGPLSNTASWQSIPNISENGDWSHNPLPDGMSIQQMAALVAKYSGHLYPTVPLLNGFCMMFNRGLLNHIGYFDEENFGEGYGEEDDYVLRARKAGWKIAWADDVYIYHAQSRSFSDERRRRLTKRAGELLFQKHDRTLIGQDIERILHDRVLSGIRVRSKVISQRAEYIRKGFHKFSGKRVLFLLPIAVPGGGGNVVIDEGMSMLEMGVDVWLFNLTIYRESFTHNYPHIKLPVIFGEQRDIGYLAHQFDAVIATMHSSVELLGGIQRIDSSPVRGYYVQGFEALMYSPDESRYKNAIESYGLFPDLVRFSKTNWVHDQVLENTGKKCHVIGISVNIDLFRPRYTHFPKTTSNQVRIGAMVRAASPYRSPELTMRVFKRIESQFGEHVQLIIFGANQQVVESLGIERDFNFWSAGEINQKQVANLLNDIDIFVDFSSHQAMGLTALEAMASGCAIIVPKNGGSVEFVRDVENGLVVDTSSEEECYKALIRLIEQDELRLNIQKQAMSDVCQFYPERAAYRILETLFVENDGSSDDCWN